MKICGNKLLKLVFLVQTHFCYINLHLYLKYPTCMTDVNSKERLYCEVLSTTLD